MICWNNLLIRRKPDSNDPVRKMSLSKPIDILFFFFVVAILQFEEVDSLATQTSLLDTPVNQDEPNSPDPSDSNVSSWKSNDNSFRGRKSVGKCSILSEEITSAHLHHHHSHIFHGLYEKERRMHECRTKEQ